MCSSMGPGVSVKEDELVKTALAKQVEQEDNAGDYGIAQKEEQTRFCVKRDKTCGNEVGSGKRCTKMYAHDITRTGL